MDGYFPSELQSRFPDGIPFEVYDLVRKGVHQKKGILQLCSSFEQVCDRRNEEFISRLTFAGERRAGEHHTNPQ